MFQKVEEIEINFFCSSVENELELSEMNPVCQHFQKILVLIELVNGNITITNKTGLIRDKTMTQ